MMKINQVNIKLIMILGFGLALVLVLLVQYFSNSSINNLIVQENELFESSRTIQTIESIKASTVGFESKIRGFVLTGNEALLEGYEVNQIKSIESVGHLHDIVTNAEEIKYITQLDKLVQEKINFNRKTLILYSKNNPKLVIDLINTERGKQIMDSINYLSDKITLAEQKDIEHRIVQNQIYVSKVKAADLIAVILVIILIVASLIIIYNDISKRTRLEKDLREANQNVEKSALIKEQFMANMSHEIRTPMNAIIGYIQRLKRTELSKEQQEYLHSLNHVGENLLTIINDILDFSKIEEGMLNIEEVNFNLQGLMHSVTRMFQIKASQKNIKLLLNPLENIPEILKGDSIRLTQILVNLISNAVKFTNEGHIELSAKLVKDDFDSVKIQFFVKDTGIGIPNDKLQAIFERFNQGNSDTTRKYGGTGLGLSIVKNLVELMGGVISVKSDETKGSIFSFTLPFKKVDNESVNDSYLPISKPPVHQLNLRVLVTEDNHFNQNLLNLLLKDWHVAFDMANNGLEAIDYINRKSYDVILMDVQMPKMNGYEATQYIRHELKNNTPIIAMTAHAFAGEKEKCISLGMNNYISKPIREDELFNLLKSYEKESVNYVYNEANFKVVNLNYVRDMSFGRERFVQEMIDLFLKEVPVELVILLDAIKNKDFVTIKHISHKLQSTIPFAGIDKLIEKDLSGMEFLADNKIEIDKIKQLFENVNTICHQAFDDLTIKI